MARPEKAAVVEEIRERFNESNAALLTEYRGMGVKDLQELRRALRAADTEYKVLKNTLVRIAARDVGLEDLVDLLVGPTAIAFVKGDAVAAAKALDEAAKALPVLVIKGGVLGNQIMDADQARALAKVPPREVQLATIAMMMNSPVQQTVNVFAALLRDFGSMLAQVLAKKESGELPAGDAPASAAPVTEASSDAGTDAAPAAAAATAETPAGETASEEAPPAAEASAEGADRGEGLAEASDVAADTSDAPAAEEAVGSEEAQAAPPTTGTDAADGGE